MLACINETCLLVQLPSYWYATILSRTHLGISARALLFSLVRRCKQTSVIKLFYLWDNLKSVVTYDEIGDILQKRQPYIVFPWKYFLNIKKSAKADLKIKPPNRRGGSYEISQWIHRWEFRIISRNMAEFMKSWVLGWNIVTETKKKVNISRKYSCVTTLTSIQLLYAS